MDTDRFIWIMTPRRSFLVKACGTCKRMLYRYLLNPPRLTYVPQAGGGNKYGSSGKIDSLVCLSKYLAVNCVQDERATTIIRRSFTVLLYTVCSARISYAITIRKGFFSDSAGCSLHAQTDGRTGALKRLTIEKSDVYISLLSIIYRAFNKG